MKADQMGWNNWQNFAQDWAETCSLMAQADHCDPTATKNDFPELNFKCRRRI